MTLIRDDRAPIIRLKGTVPPGGIHSGLLAALEAGAVHPGGAAVLDISEATLHPDFGTALRMRDAVFASPDICAVAWHVVPGTELNTALARRLVMLVEDKLALMLHDDLATALDHCCGTAGSDGKRPPGRAPAALDDVGSLDGT